MTVFRMRNESNLAGRGLLARIPLIAVIAELRRVNRRDCCLAVSDVVVVEAV